MFSSNIVQIDNLRTNYKGTYVLQDNAFRAFTRMGGGEAERARGTILLGFAVGLIRGALTCAGIRCKVSGEITTLPGCKFNLDLQAD